MVHSFYLWLIDFVAFIEAHGEAAARADAMWLLILDWCDCCCFELEKKNYDHIWRSWPFGAAVAIKLTGRLIDADVFSGYQLWSGSMDITAITIHILLYLPPWQWDFTNMYYHAWHFYTGSGLWTCLFMLARHFNVWIIPSALYLDSLICNNLVYIGTN